MDDQKLKKLLEQLQVEIEHADHVDAKGKDLLLKIDRDVHELLNRPQNETLTIHPRVIERLERTIDHLEISHPGISQYLTELLEILSKAGI
jgi:hypothetical protein